MAERAKRLLATSPPSDVDVDQLLALYPSLVADPQTVALRKEILSCLAKLRPASLAQDLILRAIAAEDVERARDCAVHAGSLLTVLWMGNPELRSVQAFERATSDAQRFVLAPRLSLFKPEGATRAYYEQFLATRSEGVQFILLGNVSNLGDRHTTLALVLESLGLEGRGGIPRLRQQAIGTLGKLGKRGEWDRTVAMDLLLEVVRQPWLDFDMALEIGRIFREQVPERYGEFEGVLDAAHPRHGRFVREVLGGSGSR